MNISGANRINDFVRPLTTLWGPVRHVSPSSQHLLLGLPGAAITKADTAEIARTQRHCWQQTDRAHLLTTESTLCYKAPLEKDRR